MAAHGPDAALAHVRQLVSAEVTMNLSDGQLLHLYSSQHDHQAFTALLRRHERLVWNVCRRALGHHQLYHTLNIGGRLEVGAEV